MNKIKIPYIYYYYLHSMMYEKYGEGEVSIKKARDYLYEWRILKVMRPIIIKELEMFGLIEMVNKKTIKINKSLFNKEDVSKIYTEIGLC